MAQSKSLLKCSQKQQNLCWWRITKKKTKTNRRRMRIRIGGEREDKETECRCSADWHLNRIQTIGVLLLAAVEECMLVAIEICSCCRAKLFRFSGLKNRNRIPEMSNRPMHPRRQRGESGKQHKNEIKLQTASL